MESNVKSGALFSYNIMIIGNNETLDIPLKEGSGSCFGCGMTCESNTFNTDPVSERFGKPELCKVFFYGETLPKLVHYTRIILGFNSDGKVIKLGE